MKKLFLLVNFCVATSTGFAQWKTQIGVNMLPISIGSYEITSEFSANPHLALTANVGYLNKTRYEGLYDYDIGDGVKNRRTSGTFLKLGARYYVLKPAEQPRRVNLFLGALVIGSHYARTADVTDLRVHTVEQVYEQKSKTGFSWGPAMNIGLSFRLGKRVSLDTGMQFSYLMGDEGWIGRKNRNYEPGFGTRPSPGFPGFPGTIRRPKFFPTNDQVVTTLKYKF